MIRLSSRNILINLLELDDTKVMTALLMRMDTPVKASTWTSTEVRNEKLFRKSLLQ